MKRRAYIVSTTYEKSLVKADFFVCFKVDTRPH